MSMLLRKVAGGCDAGAGVVAGAAVVVVALLPLRPVCVVCSACAPALAATRTDARSRIDRLTQPPTDRSYTGHTNYSCAKGVPDLRRRAHLRQNVRNCWGIPHNEHVEQFVSA